MHENDIHVDNLVVVKDEYGEEETSYMDIVNRLRYSDTTETVCLRGLKRRMVDIGGNHQLHNEFSCDGSDIEG